MEEGSASTGDRVVKNIFRNYMTWRRWILQLLTSETSSKLRLPWGELPSVLQEASIGINFASPGNILSKDFLSLAAIQCDKWFVKFATFYSAALDGNKKKILFEMIKREPKLHDVVTEQRVRENTINTSNTEGNKAQASGLKRSFEEASKYQTASRKKASKHQGASRSPMEEETLEPTKDVHDDLNVHEECGICRGEYTFQHWIACDNCMKWFHCKCVQITPAEAELKPSHECLSCFP